MASGAFVEQSNVELDQMFGDTPPTVPATWYVALFTVTPNKNGGGTEVSGGSYARVAVTNDTTNWPNADNQRKSNGLEIEFATASANWGTVVAAAIVDTASGAFTQGFFGSLTSPVIINSGQQRFFPVGGLVIIRA